MAPGSLASTPVEACSQVCYSLVFLVHPVVVVVVEQVLYALTTTKL